MKKDTRFFSWLNNTIFWKNFNLMKTSKDDKRLIMAIKHGIKQKGLTRNVPNRRIRRVRGVK